ncbi:interleukin 15, like isoform X2 [Tachysurus vachellii]|uniref:interleukin 15, like isoform X2 n=1 Tax=Tachysurus vachellii TaxID=175792 RepID=UPI00296ACD80|nr:interleukin 15, like isoform X2 [Tachysurus vachellii]
MRRDSLRMASRSWNMVLRREDQHQVYMELTPLLFYIGAMVLRQAKCNSICSIETSELVEAFLLKLTKMEFNDFRLYTPTLQNYKKCSRSTLECFQKEMTVLVKETKENSSLPKRLQDLQRRLSNKMPPCPKCEVYNETQAEIFLETLRTILQFICTT